MADLYSVLPGLQPSSQDVLEAELLAKQILETKYPTLDLREGTGLRDLLIRPLAVFVALTRNGLDYLLSQNTLSTVDDTTPSDLVDSILSNWFLTRKIGTQSVISARIYFSRRKNVAVSTDIYFSTDNTLKFYPSDSYTFSSDSLVYDSYSNEYYVDVDLNAEKEGSAYNIGSGSLLYFSNFDPYFLRAEINYLKEASIESESNTQFISRAKTAISTRNLINDPSIDSNLKEEFNYIDRLVTVGMGDTDMVRDKIKAVFPDPKPILPNAITVSNYYATVNAPNHGYTPGQMIFVTGAVPSDYNGVQVVYAADQNTFGFYLPTKANAVTVLPTISAYNIPTIIHNGGMVDIYCSDTLATSIIQVTTDSKGQAHLTGPIYNIARSTISGGLAADTMAQNASFTVTPANTENIKISGMVGSGKTITVTMSNHGYDINQYITVAGSAVSAFNGSWRISSVIDSNTFVVNTNTDMTGKSATSTDPSYCYTSVPFYDYGFSQKQDVIVDFGSLNAGKTASFQIGYFQYLDSIQNYLEDSANRVLCADYLARGFNFYHLYIDITSYNGPAPDPLLAQNIIESYLRDLNPGDMFVVSDMMTKLRLNGLTNLQNPPVIQFRKYTRFLTPYETGTITDILDPADATNVFLLAVVNTHSQSLNSDQLYVY